MSTDSVNIKVISVNISEKKGTIKKPVDSIMLDNHGVQGDAHAGPWHRQVSLLGIESVKKFEKEAGRRINYGEFAEGDPGSYSDWKKLSWRFLRHIPGSWELRDAKGRNLLPCP